MPLLMLKSFILGQTLASFAYEESNAGVVVSVKKELLTEMKNRVIMHMMNDNLKDDQNETAIVATESPTRIYESGQ